MRGGIVLALLVASVAALLFFDLALKATAQLRSHIPARPDEIEMSHSTNVTEGGQPNHGAR